MSKQYNRFVDYFNRSDKILWLISLVTSIYCLIILASVSRTGSNVFFVQLIAIVAGYAGAVLLTSVDYHVLANMWKFISIFCVGIIAYSLIFGIAVEGSAGINAKAWIKLPGGITFQPSELVKIGFIITFSKHLSFIKEKDKFKSFSKILGLAIHALVPIVLTHLQGDDGAAMIFFCMFVIMSFAAGVPIKYFVIMTCVLISLIPVAWNYLLADYQKQRLINQFNPESDPLNMGYQQIQGKISIGSGQIFGKGLFKGNMVGQEIVPIQESDFIISAVGEELGFIGCLLVVSLLFAMIMRTLIISANSCDTLGAYICVGFMSLIISQTIFNLGMCLSILPVMGVTLPFFSAGGSSAACLYLGFGLVQNVYINRHDTKDFRVKFENKKQIN